MNLNKSIHFFVLLFIVADNLEAQLSGNPGEIIAIKIEKESSNLSLTIEKDNKLYQLIPLPFNKQGEYLTINKKEIYINKKDFGESRITISDTSKVNLNQKDLERVNIESQIINNALNTFSRSFKSELNFIKPVEGLISSRYGKKRFINGTPRSPHLALDIAAVTGTPIVAPDYGKIILVGNFFYSGNFIIIDHGYGLLSSYSHLSKIDISENEFVQKGQKIGEVGSTGRVTGPHLHWTIYLNKVRINPEVIIQENYLDLIL